MYRQQIQTKTLMTDAKFRLVLIKYKMYELFVECHGDKVN